MEMGQAAIPEHPDPRSGLDPYTNEPLKHDMREYWNHDDFDVSELG
jgi:hypothetical protein